MASHPLLLFSTPESADGSKGNGGPSNIHLPTYNRQGNRLSPIFNQLQTEFNSRRVELQQTAAGADPEQVLVIEIIGSVEDFANAVKRIDGLEWMGENETEEILPDEDFYNEKYRDKALNGRLYLVMSNQKALNQILSLWRRYKDDKDIEFARGLAKFRNVFLLLKDIRRWGVQDRIEETGILDVWREDLELNSTRAIRFEIELWFHHTDAKRQAAKEQVEKLVKEHGGTVLNDYSVADINYHALLAEIPAIVAQRIAEHPNVDLIKCDSVMFFRPLGQMITGKWPIVGEMSDCEANEAPIPNGDPIIAILDGLPLENHNLLANRLIIDDPDDYASDYSVQDRLHGTAMASLVVHGDLNDGATPLSRPVYVRPIMKPIHWIRPPNPEQIPDNVLVVDHIHRAVRRMFEGEGTGDAIAPKVRIINFSIGDPYRQFTQVMSPLARLLDWLSVKYQVLFIISAGNHIKDITTNIPKTTYDALPNNEKENEIVKSLYGESRHRRILSPGESINGITVGALHYDNFNMGHIENIGHAVNLFDSFLPSPISAFGNGHRRSIKPDILFTGGRVLFTEAQGSTLNSTFKFLDTRDAPGNKVASPSSLAGDVNKAAYCRGTSNSAALISRMAATYYDTVVDIFDEQAPEIELNSYIAPLLKAMIIHGCSWGEIGNQLRGVLQTQTNSQQIRNVISRWLGYGVPESERVTACTEQRATLIGFGQLNAEEAHIFTLPLPPSLGARREMRRLTVTLAWMSPIAPNTQRYRTASLWFEVIGESLAPNRKDVDWKSVRRGTVQHEVFEGDKVIVIGDDTDLKIKVNCQEDAAKILEPVAYGLVVSLEVAEGVDIAIYEEIRTRIMSAIEIRARGDR